MAEEEFDHVLKKSAKLAGCAVLLLIALLIGGFVFLVLYFDPSKTDEHKELLELYSVIEIGMSKDEVKSKLPPTSDRLSVREWGRTIDVTTPTGFFPENRTMDIYFDNSETVIYVRVRKVDSGKAIGTGDPADKVDGNISEETLHQINEGFYE